VRVIGGREKEIGYNEGGEREREREREWKTGYWGKVRNKLRTAKENTDKIDKQRICEIKYEERDRRKEEGK
jgi:hypothetical protein